MPNYQNGAVYALTDEVGVPFYVGSTTANIHYRFDVHKCYATRFPNRLVYRWFEHVGGVDKVRVQLLTAFPCNTKEELLAEEQRHIMAHGTHLHGANHCVAGGRPGSKYARSRGYYTRYQRERYQRLRQERLAVAAPMQALPA